MPAPEVVKRLVDRFEEYKERYTAGTYNETQVRVEFVDPFFRELGWDIDNSSGMPEAFKDVIHEDALRIGSTIKAPDYSFRIGGERKFFLETKKPAVNLRESIPSAFQLRRYGWSAKLPFSILTDFAEFAIYDCRVLPLKTDKARTSRLTIYSYKDYLEKWDEIYSLFSKEAVLSGSLEKYASQKRIKRGSIEVDDAFLEEIDSWRTELAQNFALRNLTLSQRELNFSVQATLDRIIFLRICEDRGIESYGNLLSISSEANLYSKLCETFRRADQRYNSGLFHFQLEQGRTTEPDSLTLSLNVDSSVLKKIVRSVYFPESPYEFSVIPADILGSVYERFLGKVIRLTTGHRAKVEDKPEVLKAGGVFYTPKFIVKHIVENTVGKLVSGKTPRQIDSIKILDPACGSGSFLIQAYQRLLDTHLSWYETNNAEKWSRGRNATIYQSGQGWKLTPAEKKRILINNIFGVDVDPQAVEVTKLSLSLKVLEGETADSVNNQLRLFDDRALPDMDNNIRSGNTLVEQDFYRTGQLLLLDEEDKYRINAFDWQFEFSEIIRNGGFTAVIGNPPWISLSGKFGNNICSPELLQYLISKYSGNTYMPNMYEYFVAKGMSLVKKDGYFSFIVPDRLGFNNQFVGLRKSMLENFSIKSLVYKMPFPKITADTLVFVLEKTETRLDVKIEEFNKGSITKTQQALLALPDHVFEYFENEETQRLANKMLENPKVKPLSSIFFVTSGFGGKSKLITEQRTSPTQIEALKGDSIERYGFRAHYYFDFKPENLTGRTTNRAKLGSKPKILLRKTGDKIIATFDNSGIFPEQSLYFLFSNRTSLDFKYFLGVINSKPMNFYFQAKSLTNKDSMAQVKNVDLEKLPIFMLNLENPFELETHRRIVLLVEQMLEQKVRLNVTRVDTEKNVILRQLASIDGEIDQLVFRLYGFTESEIEMITAA